MSLLREMRAIDLLSLESTNLDPLTETYNITFYLEYLTKWPDLCYVIVSHTGTIEGYIIGKVEASPSPYNQPSKLPYDPATNMNDKYLPWHAHVTALTVAPAARRLGHARKLTEILEQKGNEMDAYFVDLFVRVENVNAITMYKSMGYSVFRRVVKYYDNESDAFDMRKPLARDKNKLTVREDGENQRVDPEDVWDASHTTPQERFRYLQLLRMQEITDVRISALQEMAKLGSDLREQLTREEPEIMEVLADDIDSLFDDQYTGTSTTMQLEDLRRLAQALKRAPIDDLSESGRKSSVAEHETNVNSWQTLDGGVSLDSIKNVASPFDDTNISSENYQTDVPSEDGRDQEAPRIEDEALSPQRQNTPIQEASNTVSTDSAPVSDLMVLRFLCQGSQMLQYAIDLLQTTKRAVQHDAADAHTLTFATSVSLGDLENGSSTSGKPDDSGRHLSTRFDALIDPSSSEQAAAQTYGEQATSTARIISPTPTGYALVGGSRGRLGAGLDTITSEQVTLQTIDDLMASAALVSLNESNEVVGVPQRVLSPPPPDSDLFDKECSRLSIRIRMPGHRPTVVPHFESVFDVEYQQPGQVDRMALKQHLTSVHGHWYDGLGWRQKLWVHHEVQSSKAGRRHKSD